MRGHDLAHIPLRRFHPVHQVVANDPPGSALRLSLRPATRRPTRRKRPRLPPKARHNRPWPRTSRSSSASSTSVPRTDYGYNQAHAEGAAALAKLPGVKIREEEKVPETVAVQKTMESMINLDGATLLFPTSFGYFDPHILKVAREVPERHLPALRRPLPRKASTRRTSAATSATSTRRSTSPASSPA